MICNFGSMAAFKGMLVSTQTAKHTLKVWLSQRRRTKSQGDKKMSESFAKREKLQNCYFTCNFSDCIRWRSVLCRTCRLQCTRHILQEGQPGQQADVSVSGADRGVHPRQGGNACLSRQTGWGRAHTVRLCHQRHEQTVDVHHIQWHTGLSRLSHYFSSNLEHYKFHRKMWWLIPDIFLLCWCKTLSYIKLQKFICWFGTVRGKQ